MTSGNRGKKGPRPPLADQHCALRSKNVTQKWIPSRCLWAACELGPPFKNLVKRRSLGNSLLRHVRDKTLPFLDYCSFWFWRHWNTRQTWDQEASASARDSSCIYAPHPMLSGSEALLYFILVTSGFIYLVLLARKAKALRGLNSLVSKEPALQSSVWFRNTFLIDSVYRGRGKHSLPAGNQGQGPAHTTEEGLQSNNAFSWRHTSTSPGGCEGEFIHDLSSAHFGSLQLPSVSWGLWRCIYLTVSRYFILEKYFQAERPVQRPEATATSEGLPMFHFELNWRVGGNFEIGESGRCLWRSLHNTPRAVGLRAIQHNWKFLIMGITAIGKITLVIGQKAGGWRKGSDKWLVGRRRECRWESVSVWNKIM